MTSLSKTRRNAVFQTIAASPLGVNGCEFSSEIGLYRVNHVPSESAFEIYPDGDDGFFRIWYRVGDEDAREREWGIGTFGNVLGAVTDWATDVRQWIDIPDLWSISQSSSASVPGGLFPDSENTPFTAAQQATISAQLREISESIKKAYELTAEQSAKLDEKFEEAEKASRRMGRKDWGLLFGGAVFSLILADVITPGVAGHILMMVEHGIGHLFGAPPISGALAAGQG